MTEKPYWLDDGDAAAGVELTPPSTTDLRRFAGMARREKPILELGPVGRWSARIKVVPIVGAATSSMFDVVVNWVGPPAPPMGGPRGQVVDAETSYLVPEDRELAFAIARGVEDILRDGQVPMIDDVAESIREAGGDWRRRYDGVVGDAGKAAAEGF